MRTKERYDYSSLEERRVLACVFGSFAPADAILIGSPEAETVVVKDGSQFVHTGGGDDTIESLGDFGEPTAAQDPTVRITERNPEGSYDDTFIGDRGADTYIFKPLINAKDEIILKHTTDGVVDWTGDGVAGENGNVHDHWVEGIGQDTILGFESGVDSIVIEGHTANANVYNDPAGYSIISIFSDQNGDGAHNGDNLGNIYVYGDPVLESDVTVDAGVFHAVDQLDDWELPEDPEQEEKQEQALQDLLAQLRETLEAIDRYFESLA